MVQSYEQWRAENPLLAEYEELQEYLSEHEEEVTEEDLKRFDELEHILYDKGGILDPSK